MKYSLIKFKLFFAVSCLIMIASCVKERAGFTDLSKVHDMVIINTSGLANFASAKVSVNSVKPDTLKFPIIVEFAGVNSATSDVTVKLGVEDALRVAYNTANSKSYQPLASNQYKILNTTLTIPKGQHYAQTTLEVYQNKYTSGIPYMLPVSITDASGVSLSSNQNTKYFNFTVAGNPLDFKYTWVYKRWNAADTTGALASPTPTTTPNTAGSPDNDTKIEFQSGYGAQNALNIRYVLSFTNTGGVLSNFSVVLNPDDVANNLLASSGIGALSYVPAKIVYVDGATKRFKFYYSIVNSAGAARSFTDEFYIP